MTVGQLQYALEQFPDNLEVFTHKTHYTDDGEESSIYKPVVVTGAYERANLDKPGTHVQLNVED